MVPGPWRPVSTLNFEHDFRCFHGRTVKALANHFGGPGSIPSAGCSESEPGCEIFAPVPDAALNGCELHVKSDFNF